MGNLIFLYCYFVNRYLNHAFMNNIYNLFFLAYNFAFQVQRKCLLNVIIDEGCPFRVLNAFIDSWSFAGASDPILFEWLNEKLSELVKEKGQLCELFISMNTLLMFASFTVLSVSTRR